MSALAGRLSPADAAWLHMDRPTNLMVINSVLRFEEPLDWDRLAGVIRGRLVEAHPRFRQRVVEGRLRGGPRWQDDPHFELSRHLHRRGLAEPCDERALKDLAGDLAAEPLDRDKPLWEMYLIDGPGDGSAVIVRMHHCIADGIALARVLLSLTDSAPGDPVDPGVQRGRERRAGGLRACLRDPLAAGGRTAGTAIAPAVGAVGASARLVRGATREGLELLVRPARALELAGSAADDVRVLGKLLFTSGDTHTALKGELGASRGVAWSRPLELERVRAVAHAQGATINDVLLAAVSGALRGHLLARGEDPPEIRTMVPVNLRPLDQAADELGNRFGLVFLTLPVDRSSRRERLEELKRRMSEIKRSPEGPISYGVLELVGLAPVELEGRMVDIFTSKATAVMTNVPGPRETVYLAGSPLSAVLVWAPTAGSVGMSVSIFSYAGRITIGLLVHAALVPDPTAILDRVHREVAALARLAPALGGTVA